MKNIFDPSVSEEIIHRINQLNKDTQPQWGTMSVGQMLAHCNVTYEFIFEPEKHKKPTGIKKWLIKTFVKNIVVTDKPYKKNSRTAPAFLMTTTKDFESEKTRLIDYIHRVQALGADHFEGKESHSFGKLSKEEWNTMLYKHLDHHLSQFGV